MGASAAPTGSVAGRGRRTALALRRELGLFANTAAGEGAGGGARFSPLRPEIVTGADILIVRELTGGIYFGEKTRDAERATDLCAYTVTEIERVARVAFAAARERRHHVTSVDKANVMETGRLWRDTVERLGREEFPDVDLDHALVDSTAMKIVQSPRSFDVMRTENMFGTSSATRPHAAGHHRRAALGLARGGGAGGCSSRSTARPRTSRPQHGQPGGAILSAADAARQGRAAGRGPRGGGGRSTGWSPAAW